jgi:conjugative relaxase-like TrwC/TraI family protein
MAVSIGKVSNGGYTRHLTDTEKSGAAEYYKGEDVPSAWSGRGAEMQGLRGEVRDEDLRDQLAGRITDSTGRRNLSEENSRQRTEGFDITVSAPKSVSIEALARENKDVLDAHREANQAVLDKLESLARTEYRESGRKQREDTGNITAASYEHHGSVAGDPHLHTHNAVMNTTFDHEGKARALDAREIYGNVEVLRETYDNALEKALNDRGLSTYRDANGHPQLEGYSREGMEQFSVRSAQIEKRVNETGRDAASARERELARQETRRGQQHEPKSREETLADWREQLDSTRGVGPAQKSEAAPAKPPPKQEQARPVSREEFRDAKWVVNAEKDARAKIESGAYKHEAHREQLERRIEEAENLRARNPDLYERAEKSVERMGVRDPDAQRQAADRERIAQKVDAHERASKEDFAKAARTVNDMKDAQAKLDGGRYDTREHKAELEKRVEAGQTLRDQDPRLFASAEKSVERRGVKDADAQAASRAQVKADWQTLKDADLAAGALKSDAGIFMGVRRKELSAADKRGMETAFNSRGDKFLIDKRGNVFADKLQGRREPKETFFKSEKGWAGGEKDYMMNAKGEVFVRGSGFAGGAQQGFADSLKVDGRGAAAKAWNNMIQRSVGAKWTKADKEDTKRIQREAESARKDFYNARIEMRRELQRDIERVTTAFSERPQEMAKAFDSMLEKGRDVSAPKQAREDLSKGREQNRASAQQHEGKASAVEKPKPDGRATAAQEQAALQRFDQRLSEGAKKEADLEAQQRAAQQAAWQQEAANSKAAFQRVEDSSKGAEGAFVAGVAGDAMGKAGTVAEAASEVARTQSPQEAEKAAQESRDHAAAEQQRDLTRGAQEDAIRKQAAVEDASKAKGAGDDVDRARTEEAALRRAAKQASQEKAGQDDYTSGQVDQAILDRREQRSQEDRTAQAGGQEVHGAREDKPRDLDDLREQADRLAETVIRREGARGAEADRAMGFDARKATAQELSEFIEKHGTPQQREELQRELAKREQYEATQERRQNQQKADKEAHERTYGRLS